MKIATGTIVRTAMMIIAIVNTFCSMVGFTTIDIDENTLYTIVTCVFDVVTLVVVWWKDNSFSKRALALEEIKKAMKEDGVKKVIMMFGEFGKSIADMFDDPKEVK